MISVNNSGHVLYNFLRVDGSSLARLLVPRNYYTGGDLVFHNFLMGVMLYFTTLETTFCNIARTEKQKARRCVVGVLFFLHVILIATKTHSLRELRYNTHTHTTCVFYLDKRYVIGQRRIHEYMYGSLWIFVVWRRFLMRPTVCVWVAFFFDAIYIYVIVTCVN